MTDLVFPKLVLANKALRLMEMLARVKDVIAMEFINTLKQYGCKFLLDDFGLGLSSFAYLGTFPVDYLIIDESFAKEIVEDPIDHALVKSINEIGQNQKSQFRLIRCRWNDLTSICNINQIFSEIQ